MILVVKHRFAYYKRFELDIWGIARSSLLNIKKQWVISNYLKYYKNRKVKYNKNNISQFLISKINKFYNKKKKFLRSNYLKRKNAEEKNLFLKKIDLFLKNNKSKKYLINWCNTMRVSILNGQEFGVSWYFNKRKVNFDQLFLLKSKFVSKICSFFFKLFLERQEYKNWRKKRYVYRIDIIKPQKKKHFFKKKFISLRLVKLFYLTLSYRAFRKLALKAKKQDGLFESNFLFLLEGRIVPIVYRSGLAFNMFEILSLVRTAQVYVNKTFYNNLNFSVKVFDLISFSAKVSRYLYFSLLSRLLRRRKKSVLFNSTKFLFVSYKLMCFFLKRHPHEKDLIFPVGVDIYRATGFFN